ncbi:hypothetical protein [Chryseobacterium sp.]|uniref:hypothetical protein n=1 Tax=Chryseobacterium sp. TaxID=1871047 RepID=UPI0011C6F4E8|nr:hypothetical protein [Chryseobacterium sp.]TXF75806.1 hypothetical protein FUA25_07840 [Chryseobacterium sp.]
MKKLILILLGMFFISCTQDKPADEGDIRLNKETFDSFASQLKLDSNFSVPITSANKSTKGAEISSILLKLLEDVQKKIKSNPEIGMIIFEVYHDGTYLNFQNFREIATAERSKYGLVSSEGWFDHWKCPAGQTLSNKCYTQSCAQQTLSALAPDFSSGETITIHDGGIGGVKICSNVKP